MHRGIHELNAKSIFVADGSFQEAWSTVDPCPCENFILQKMLKSECKKYMFKYFYMTLNRFAYFHESNRMAFGKLLLSLHLV